MLEKIAREKTVETIAQNIGVSNKFMDDFVQEIYLILLEYDKEKLETMYFNNQLNFFLTRIIKNQYCSITSPFYKKYRKYYDVVDANTDCYGTEDNEDDRYTIDD